MRILDLYLIRTFLMPWLTCVAGFSFLFVIVDLVESLEKFVDAEVSLFGIFAYYLRFLPSIWVYIGPITLLLGLLYTLYQLTRNNEIIAMRASGISLYRIILPFLIMGVVVSLFSGHISQTVAPRNQEWLESYFQRIKNPDSLEIGPIRFKQTEENRDWEISSLHTETGTARQVVVWQYRTDGSLEYTLTADKALWMDDYWFFHTATIQQHSENGYKFGPADERQVVPKTEFTESPERMIRENKEFELLTSREIRTYLKERESVSPKTRAESLTHLYMRQGHPWLCLVTMLMAAPFGTQTARKGVFAGVSMCLGLFFGLFFMMTLFKALGVGMRIPPWWAGWTPTLLFAALGMFFLRKLR